VNPRLARWLIGLYPRDWRDRYGEEFEQLLLSEGAQPLDCIRVIADVIHSAVSEYIVPTLGGNMQTSPRSFGSILKQPSAFLPMAMSLTGLALVLGHIAIYGPAREADEGAVAHLWQLLMAGQLPVLAYFAIKWLPLAPKPTLCVLVLQFGAALAAMAPVFLLNL
jgi:hypothetical protein